MKGDAVSDSVSEVLTVEEIGKLLATLRNRFAGATYTIDDFNEIQDELALDLDEIVGDWLFDTELPGFQLYEPKVVRLLDDDLGVPVYQTTFYLKNEEPSPGVIKLSFDERRDEGTPEFGGDSAAYSHRCKLLLSSRVAFRVFQSLESACIPFYP